MVVFSQVSIMRFGFQRDFLFCRRVVMHMLRFGVPYHANFTNAPSNWKLSTGAQHTEPCYKVFTKKFSCQKGGVEEANVGAVPLNANVGRNAVLKFTSRSRKLAKPPSAGSSGGESQVSVSNSLERPCHDAFSMMTPAGGLTKDVTKDEPSEAHASASVSYMGNKKSTWKTGEKRSRRKKDNEQPCDTVVSSDRLKVSSKSTGSDKIEKKCPNLSRKKSATSGTIAKQPSKEAVHNLKRTDKSFKKENKKKLVEFSASIVGSTDIPSSGSNSVEPNSGLVKKSKPHLQSITKQLYPANGRSVVVVESVTKAKVIQGYLGNMYEVLSSYGHVRDLAARSGSVRPDEDFSMVWEVPSAAWSRLKSIKVALNGAKNLILASDPDREGEAIAWHIIEMLQQQNALPKDVTVARVVFHEITESSIKNALMSPRVVDQNLVNAYLARRALDYLIGFNISPLLWRKLPGCQSAGRVQSAALSLICDREKEVEEFKAKEYWTIEADFVNRETRKYTLRAYLIRFESKKLNQFSISTHTEAKHIEEKVYSSDMWVIGHKVQKMRKNPPYPYITSTLQQDAANKHHFSALYTMNLAQKLYEGVRISDGELMGLITYIRTDGLHISPEAVNDVRSLVTERYGKKSIPAIPRTYSKKVKNAQEAHEAIRPTNIKCLPSTLNGVVDEDSMKLYKLIWSRTVACQMEPALISQIQVDIGTADGGISFRSTCSKVDFFGYQAVYNDAETQATENKKMEALNDDESLEMLNSLKIGDRLSIQMVEPKQHYTMPPPRFSEASLVKKMEELGIGRPSTYASTLKALQDRNYVSTKGRMLFPDFRGRMVSSFLSHHFSEVADYSFTADMETGLDNVSAGLTEWKGLLKDYWTRFKSYCDKASSVHIHQVEKMIEKEFEEFLFSNLSNQSRVCPICSEGTLVFKVSRYGQGYFIGCDHHPECKYIAKVLYSEGDGDDDVESREAKNINYENKILGTNPGTGENILLKNGPYGFYVQIGGDRTGYVPKRACVSHIKDVDKITLEDALEVLRYPLILGNHPEDGKPVLLKISRTGFTVRHRHTNASVPKKLSPEAVDLKKALSLLSGKNVRRFGRPKRAPVVSAVGA